MLSKAPIGRVYSAPVGAGGAIASERQNVRCAAAEWYEHGWQAASLVRSDKSATPSWSGGRVAGSGTSTFLGAPFKVHEMQPRRTFFSFFGRARAGPKAREKIDSTFQTKEDKDWWRETMDACDKPDARLMREKLDFNSMLGLDEEVKPGTVNAIILEHRKAQPRCMLLTRVGDFYESIGFDAVLMVQYAGLNPMGQKLPKAGCPKQNISRTIEHLGAAGFRVGVIEEAGLDTRGRKERYLGGIYSKENPYLRGIVDSEKDGDFDEPAPIVGLAFSKRGYIMVSVNLPMQTYVKEENLTEEGVIAKLRERGAAPILYIHSSLRDGAPGTPTWQKSAIKTECETRGSLAFFTGDAMEIEEIILAEVRKAYNKDGEDFEETRNVNVNRPRPLYYSTAIQIGLHPLAGMPRLLDAVMPKDASKLCRSYVKRLLLNPPPYETAGKIQEACRLLSSVCVSLPDFPCEPDYKLVKLIREREVNHKQFSQIRALSESVRAMFADEALRPIARLLLEPTELATGLIGFDENRLTADCDEIIGLISAKVPDVHEQQTDGNAIWLTIEDDFRALRDLLDENERGWRGRIKDEHLETEFNEVFAAAQTLKAVVERDFGAVLMFAKARGGALKAEVQYNLTTKGFWLRCKGLKAQPLEGPLADVGARLRHAENNGKVEANCWTTDEVTSALSAYKKASEAAAAAVRNELQSLAEALEPKLKSIRTIACFAIVAKSLQMHVTEGMQRRWVFPTLLDDPPSRPGPSAAAASCAPNPPNPSEVESALGEKVGRLRGNDKGDGNGRNEGSDENCAIGTAGKRRLSVEGLVPFWLDFGAVPNTFGVESMVLLTGPNTSGKSTILRAICAAALKANCGLMIPCAAARVPRFDAYMLRMFLSDSPAESKSSWQMEAIDTRNILTDVTEKSLVLVDELGKGTEVHDGTAFVGMVLECLDAAGCMGILATHLHGVLDMELRTRHVARMAMGTIMEDDGSGRPVRRATWKLVDGECRESLAMETALLAGIPPRLVDRALDLKQQLLQKETPPRETPLQVSPQETSLQFPPQGAPLEEPPPDLLTYFNSIQPKGTPSQNCARRKNGKPAFKALKDVKPLFKDLTGEMYFEGASKGGGAFIAIDAGSVPPPATVNRAYLYIFERKDGAFYVGETDDLRGRVKRHRSVKPPGTALDFYALHLPEGKSRSRELEASLIRKLKDAGVPLANKGDQFHTKFGVGSPAGNGRGGNGSGYELLVPTPIAIEPPF